MLRDGNFSSNYLAFFLFLSLSPTILVTGSSSILMFLFIYFLFRYSASLLLPNPTPCSWFFVCNCCLYQTWACTCSWITLIFFPTLSTDKHFTSIFFFLYLDSFIFFLFLWFRFQRFQKPSSCWVFRNLQCCCCRWWQGWHRWNLCACKSVTRLPLYLWALALVSEFRLPLPSRVHKIFVKPEVELNPYPVNFIFFWILK